MQDHVESQEGVKKWMNQPSHKGETLVLAEEHLKRSRKGLLYHIKLSLYLLWVIRINWKYSKQKKSNQYFRKNFSP